MKHDELMALARERLVRKIATQYDPQKRLAGNEEAQRVFMADLCQAIVDLLPGRENAESLGLILDRAWTALFRSRAYRTWPDPPEVLGILDVEVSRFASATATSSATKPGRPRIEQPKFCWKMARKFEPGTKLADYWTAYARESERAWEAWWSEHGYPESYSRDAIEKRAA